VIPAPYSLIASGMLYVVHVFSQERLLSNQQKAQDISDVSDKVDGTMQDLSLAIQNVGAIGEFSNVHIDQVRIAAIYLSAAVMDCLAGLIDWVTRSSTILQSSCVDISIEKGLYHSRL
jgi:hypothetical protein